MTRKIWMAYPVFAALLQVALSSHVFADVNANGNITPADPSAWTEATTAYISDGNLTVDGGCDIYSRDGHIGYSAATSGTVGISGSGSSWTLTGTGDGTSMLDGGVLHIGYQGNGQLSVTGAAKVADVHAVMGYSSTSTGTAVVSGTGSEWTTNTYFYVGREGRGELTINDGATVRNSYGILGRNTGSTGIVTVSAAALYAQYLYVGDEGHGELNISDHGFVDAEFVRVGYDGGTGIINFDSGSLCTNSLWANPSELRGTGNITTCGLLGDLDIVFDAASGPNPTITLDSLPDQSITIQLNQSSSRTLGVGKNVSGSIVIREGAAVECANGYLGYKSGSSGTAVVSGPGSTWKVAESPYYDGLSVGEHGNGQLLVENGASVLTDNIVVGYYSESDSSATVSGKGSLIQADEFLGIGLYGSGQLTIVDGGLVITGYLAVDCDNDSDSSINMKNGGMLALKGDIDGSINEFLSVVDGSAKICYWNKELVDWAPITSAVLGSDYTLEHISSGDLSGYTILAIASVPEPASLVLLVLGGLMILLLSDTRKSSN